MYFVNTQIVLKSFVTAAQRDLLFFSLMSGGFCFSKLNKQLYRRTPQLSKTRKLFLIEQQQKQEELTGNSWKKEIKPRSCESKENNTNKSTKALNQLSPYYQSTSLKP